MRKLRRLDRINGDSYELIHYLGEQGVWLALTILLFLGQTYMRMVPGLADWFAIPQEATSANVSPPGGLGFDFFSFPLLVGMYCYLALSIGRLLAIYFFLRSLGSFSYSKAQLSKRIHLLDNKLSGSEKAVRATHPSVDAPPSSSPAIGVDVLALIEAEHA